MTLNKGNLACAGVLEGNGSGGSVSGNTFVNVTSLLAMGSDSCQRVAAVRACPGARRPSALRP